MLPRSSGRWEGTGHRTLVKDSHPTRMLGIASNCHWACVGKKSEGGFSPVYVLLNFQTLTPSSGQPKSDCPT